MTEQKEKLGRCCAEDWEVFNAGTRSEHRKMTRCRAAAVARVQDDVFGNTNVCLCEKHLAKYDELHAVRVFHRVYVAPTYNDYRNWVMKLVVGEPRYIRHHGEVIAINPNERSHHNRRDWLEASTKELPLWEEILKEREAALVEHREQEQVLFQKIAETAQKVSDLRAKKEVK